VEGEVIPCGSDLVREDLMAAAGLAIRGDLSAADLRALARRERSRAAAVRMYAVANAPEGMTRAEAARLAGLERQALRDAVVRYNAEGLAGFQDRPRLGPRPRLDEAERTALASLILAGPDVEATGLSAWTLPELCREIEARWGKRFHPASLSRVVRELGFSRQKARPAHPKVDLEAQAAFAKRGSSTRWRPCARHDRASA
jgi:transposase